MSPQELLDKLNQEHSDRVVRVQEKLEPLPSTTQALLNSLQDLLSAVSIANDKCGYLGNPYEQPKEDLSVLLSAAQRISGFRAQFPWDRP